MGTKRDPAPSPDLFPSHFGPDSLAKHLAEAVAAKAALQSDRTPPHRARH